MTNHNPQFANFLQLMGQLNYCWTNTESLLIHMMAGLAKVDTEVATVIFLTLNTTRARFDLVSRLAKLDRTDSKCRDEILNLITQLEKNLRLKNKYNHCVYSFDPDGRNAKTVLMRVFDSKTKIKYGKTEALDDSEIKRIESAIANIENINHKIWELIEDYDFPI